MNSSVTSSFRALFVQLPQPIQTLARKNFRLWQRDPHHPSLHFKKVRGCWSARVGPHYRVVGLLENDTLHWFWIGSHDDYEQLIKSL
jgi:hypothetical protein